MLLRLIDAKLLRPLEDKVTSAQERVKLLRSGGNSELVQSQFVLERPVSELVRSRLTMVRSVRTCYLEV